jgi:hypothetical protein
VFFLAVIFEGLLVFLMTGLAAVVSLSIIFPFPFDDAIVSVVGGVVPGPILMFKN